jgi:hypothetical protein
MVSPFRTFASMTAFFAVGAVVIALAVSPSGWPSVWKHWGELREAQIQNSNAQNELKELEDEAKRLRDPNSEAVELLIRDQLQWQKKDELRFKHAEPPATKDNKLPLMPPQR